MIVYNKDGVTGTRICIRDWVEYIRLDFEVGCKIEPHVLDIDVDFYILKGEGEIILNSKPVAVKEDSFVAVEAGTSRSIKTYDKKMKVLVIKHLTHKKWN